MQDTAEHGADDTAVAGCTVACGCSWGDEQREAALGVPEPPGVAGRVEEQEDEQAAWGASAGAAAGAVVLALALAQQSAVELVQPVVEAALWAVDAVRRLASAAEVEERAAAAHAVCRPPSASAVCW
jgi:hypothetical protein